jgi:hypothetical protein
VVDSIAVNGHVRTSGPRHWTAGELPHAGARLLADVADLADLAEVTGS